MKLAREFNRYGVTLKPLTEDMLETIRQWRNDPEISQHMLSQNYITEDMQQKWFQSIQANEKVIYWVVWFKEQPIGVASLTAIDLNLRTAEPGMYIYPPQYRNNIVPFCVAFAMNDFAFDVLALSTLIGKIFTDNEASLRFHLKSGYLPMPLEPSTVNSEPKVTEHEGKALHWFTLERPQYEAAKEPIARFIRY